MFADTNQDGLTPKYGLLKKQPQHLEVGGCFFFILKKKFYLSCLDKVIIPMITSKRVNTSMVDIGHYIP